MHHYQDSNQKWLGARQQSCWASAREICCSREVKLQPQSAAASGKEKAAAIGAKNEAAGRSVQLLLQHKTYSALLEKHFKEISKN